MGWMVGVHDEPGICPQQLRALHHGGAGSIHQWRSLHLPHVNRGQSTQATPRRRRHVLQGQRWQGGQHHERSEQSKHTPSTHKSPPRSHQTAQMRRPPSTRTRKPTQTQQPQHDHTVFNTSMPAASRPRPTHCRPRRSTAGGHPRPQAPTLPPGDMCHMT